MNNKMAKMHIYQQLNLKNKLSTQEEQRQNHGYREGFDVLFCCFSWEGCVGEWVRGEGIKKYK